MTPETLISKIAKLNTSPVDLDVNDLFLYYYGFAIRRYRVHKVLATGVWAHDLQHCKSDGIFLTFEELASHEHFQYYGRMSKFRAFFLL